MINNNKEKAQIHREICIFAKDCQDIEIFKMKTFAKKIQNVFTKWIKKTFCKNTKLEQSNTHFYSLSPNDQIENGKNYFDALNWALSKKNEKIKNIALTGTYGSGKSSILQSFQKQNTNKDFHFLNISLATFKEEKEIKDKTEGENLLRLIELSILQQLFYRERDRKLPDSRLKKIKSFTWKNLILTTFGCFLFLVSLVLFIKSDTLSYILPKVDISSNAKIFIHYLSLIICALGIIFIILKSIRIFHNLKINKLAIKDAEIEISPEINKSVLNHNLEEILYFFESTDYNVVVIEDLDRFQETEIFTKLREINLLINNSKKIHRRVTFIYAIRDEMFADKDRTKFFDFIIPVIPHINTSNSNEILQKEIKRIADNVSETLIDDISLFIDEMRLLYNIINEFQIYKQLLSNKLSTDKLLSMIVYKNIYPCDFVKLSDYQGDLYDTINKKLEFLKQQFNEIEKEIAEYKVEIKSLDSPKIKDIKELRALYVLEYIKQINTAYKINYFYLNNTNYNFEQVLDDEIFPYLISSNPVYFGGPHQSRAQQSITFQNIEKQVDSEYTYEEREEQIKNWNNNKIQELKQHIASLEQKKNELSRKKIGELLSNKNISIEVKDNKQKLINLLLRNGYIDEDYMDYISLFHEGSLSKNDHTFLLNVKSQINTGFNHSLDRIENLIKKIHLDDFKREYILNYKLVNYILINNGYEKQKEGVFNILKNETDKSIKFIDGYIDNGDNPQLFIKELYHYRISVFDFMHRASGILDEKLAQYLKLIIENANIDDIRETSKESFLPVAISDNPNGNYELFDLISDETKIIDVLKAFDIKFKYDFTLQNISTHTLGYIYENNHYIIRADLLKIIIQAKGDFNQVDFDTQNYYAINNSNCLNLINYIEANIKDYIANVYLKLETNTKEDEKWLIKLLNNKTLTDKEKTAIIQKVETKVFDLEKIDDVAIDNILLQNSKVIPTWKNIINNFINVEDTISEYTATFLNNNENAEILSKQQIAKEPDESVTQKISRAIVLGEEINTESYALLLKSVPYYYTDLNFENLSNERVGLLIENNKLGLTQGNYNRLRENFTNLHIALIEKRKFELSNTIDKLDFDDNDIVELLKSSILSIKDKQAIIAVYDNETIIASAEILGLIGSLVNGNNSNDWDKEILKAIFTNTTKSIEEKITLFNNANHRFEKDDITKIIQSFPEPYSSIAENGKRPLLSQNAMNTDFARVLKIKKYIKDFKPEKDRIRISTFRK